LEITPGLQKAIIAIARMLLTAIYNGRMNPTIPSCMLTLTLRQNTEQFPWRKPSSFYKDMIIS